MTNGIAAGVLTLAVFVLPALGQTPATVTGALPSTITPPWTKGIQPINQENYWNAVNCGKQGGQRPLCVFYDAEVCKNDDFEMAMFTPYKQVAYQVWDAVRKKQEAPTPSYSEAQRTRIIVKLTAKPAAKNPLTAITLKRGDQVVAPVSKSLADGYIFDFAAFAPTANLTIDMVGKVRTVSCQIDQSVLAHFR